MTTAAAAPATPCDVDCHVLCCQDCACDCHGSDE
jgi:hypothetical protein